MMFNMRGSSSLEYSSHTPGDSTINVGQIACFRKSIRSKSLQSLADIYSLLFSLFV